MMLHAKNYYSWPMFHGIIQKITLAQFFWDTVYICYLTNTAGGWI